MYVMYNVIFFSNSSHKVQSKDKLRCQKHFSERLEKVAVRIQTSKEKKKE